MEWWLERGAARSDDARLEAAAAVLGAKEDDPVRGDGRAEAILELVMQLVVSWCSRSGGRGVAWHQGREEEEEGGEESKKKLVGLAIPHSFHNTTQRNTPHTYRHHHQLRAGCGGVMAAVSGCAGVERGSSLAPWR